MNITNALVVDDDIAVCRILHQMLSEEQYTVQTSQSVADALGIIEQKPFDVYVMDYKLPDGSGLDVAERIRSKGSEAPIILMSGYDTSAVTLRGQGCSRETLEELLRDILREEAIKPVAIDQIQQQVAEHFGIRPADMNAKGRRTNIVFPRQVAMYLARRHTKASLHEIGENFGGRDHGTVLHACKAVSVRMKNEDQFRQTIAGLDTKLDR